MRNVVNLPIQWLEFLDPGLAGIWWILVMCPMYSSRLTEKTHRVDECLRGLTSGWSDPCQARHLAESISHILNALDDSCLVIGVVEVGRLGDDCLELTVDGEAASRDGASAEVLRQGHRGWRRSN